MNRTINCIIIDDELNNVNLLKKMLQKYCPHVQIMATETDALKGVQLIQDLQPELVFLDVQMPKLNGFDVLRKLEPISFEVIFVTAYAEFAVEAFEFHAIGYVTKPINTQKLLAAIQHAENRLTQKNRTTDLFSLIENRITQQEETKIPLATLTGLLFVNKEDVLYCESNGNYTHFHVQPAKKIVVSKQLGEFEKQLPESDFVRIHDQYIVNLKFVVEYIKGRGGELKLSNGITLPVSNARKDMLMARFDKWLKK